MFGCMFSMELLCECSLELYCVVVCAHGGTTLRMFIGVVLFGCICSMKCSLDLYCLIVCAQ